MSFHTVAYTSQIELVHDPSLDDLALPPEDKINKLIGQTSTLLPAAAASILPKLKKKNSRDIGINAIIISINS